MDEVKLNILETKEVRAFNPVERIKTQIDGIKREFEKDYDLSNIVLGISTGIPSGVTGSITVTLTPKEKDRRKE
jgi:NH3-dependent NAD+ synthetase